MITHCLRHLLLQPKLVALCSAVVQIILYQDYIRHLLRLSIDFIYMIRVRYVSYFLKQCFATSYTILFKQRYLVTSDITLLTTVFSNQLFIMISHLNYFPNIRYLFKSHNGFVSKILSRYSFFITYSCFTIYII